MPKTLSIRISTAAEALDRFEAAWHLAQGRKAPEPVAVLSFENLPLLLATLSAARWVLLGELRRAGPVSVYALAKRLGRDYKNVHTDVAQLVRLGLVEKTGEGLVRVGWDAVRAEFRLA